MDPAPNQANVYRLLFRMAARAAEFESHDFQSRLVTSIANRYGASACSIYRCGKRRSTAWAQTAADVMGLSQDEKAYLHNLDGRLVQLAMAQRALVSALDLDVDGDVAQFLAEQLPGTDIFAFPLLVEAGPRGAVVMYLPPGSNALSEADLQAMMAIGEMLEVAEEQRQRLHVGQERVRQAQRQTHRKRRSPKRAKAAS